MYASQGWAALFSPFLIAVIAGHYLSVASLISLLHIAGAGVLFSLVYIDLNQVFLQQAVLIYMFCYIPTIPLTTTLVMSQLDEAQLQFPRIRVFGTLGWIFAGVLVGGLAIEATEKPILFAAIASVIVAVFVNLFFQSRLTKQIRGHHKGDTLVKSLGFGFLRQQNSSFWVFILSSFLISIPLSFYYAFTNTFLSENGVKGAAGWQAMGQASELVFMMLMPFFLKRWGIKKTLLAGMFAWAVRYAFFAIGYGDGGIVTGFVIIGILLHGICYDFFFVAGQIYINTAIPPSDAPRAQAFLSFVTLGIGSIVGSYFANNIYVANSLVEGGHHWSNIWMCRPVWRLSLHVSFG